jgi:transcriptional regulator with XRE-family HTH domain
MSDVERTLNAFIDAWNAGERPDVGAYLERVPAAERDELADQLSLWLELAPAPRYDAAARAAIAAEPALRAALDAAALERAPLHERVAALRARAGLQVREVAARLVASVRTGDEGRAAQYLERLERDELDASRLSARLLDALAAILGADRDTLVPGPRRLAAAPGLFRTDTGAAGDDGEALDEDRIAAELDALSRAALAPAPETAAPLDELDRLFLGGPGA